MFDVRVMWEHFQKSGGNYQNPTQCRRCQKWGHSTKNCRMDAKCMICGGSSHAKDACPVKEDTRKFECANCKGPHKANFWECPSRKRVVEARARQMKDNIRYDNGRFRDLPGRVSNNAHFWTNISKGHIDIGKHWLCKTLLSQTQLDHVHQYHYPEELTPIFLIVVLVCVGGLKRA